jgi:hypothetical protein
MWYCIQYQYRLTENGNHIEIIQLYMIYEIRRIGMVLSTK